MFNTKVGKKIIESKRQAKLSVVLLSAVITLVLGIAAPDSWAEDDDIEIPFAIANIFFELNDTDGDLGIHALIDGEPWKKLEIENPKEREILDIRVRGRLRRQGLTEIFYESAEPVFDELPPEVFFRRFPEGEYEIEGITLDGQKLESTALLTHVMPAPPGNIMISGVSAAEDCDADPLPAVSEPVVISWNPVTESHPEIGKEGPIEVVKYQVVVTQEDLGIVLSVDLPPTVTELEIPVGFTALSEEFKFEILVREASGNQTAVESCFVIE